MISVMESIRHYGKTVGYNIGQYLRWLFLGAVTGLVVGLVAAAFSHCLTLATAFRTSHRFLFLLLPAGGLLIVFLYKALHYENNHGTDSIIESIHTKVAIPLKMAFLIFVSTVITIFSAVPWDGKARRCRWGRLWEPPSGTCSISVKKIKRPF